MSPDDLADSSTVETADTALALLALEEQNADLNTHGEAVIGYEEAMNEPCRSVMVALLAPPRYIAKG